MVGSTQLNENSKMSCRMLLLSESIRNFSLDAYTTNGDRSFFVDFPRRKPLVVAYPFGTRESIKRRVTSPSPRRSVGWLHDPFPKVCRMDIDIRIEYT
uniref:Uncharacterized protein n=1 Tax=Vespula pensylvanica TaxID=30213 RepID=A0A834PB62_VESPE|nr:hypothetical protein H0235_002954 [Vespula pensylvanica]